MKITSTQLLSALSERLTHVSLVKEGQNFILEETTNHDRTEKPVVCSDMGHEQGATQTRFSHDSTDFGVDDKNKP